MSILIFNFILYLFADIQEFYELTLLDDTKTIQQKTVETLQIASKWEQENSYKISDVSKYLYKISLNLQSIYIVYYILYTYFIVVCDSCFNFEVTNSIDFFFI